MLTSLALIFLCGLLLGSLFKKLRLPSLIGMLITGIILGPYVLNLLDESILLIGPDLREIALIIILTRAGLTLDLEDLKKVGRPAILMSFIPACFEIAATIIFAPMLLKITYLEATLLATIIASASPAVIIPRMIHLIENKYGTDKKIPQMILAADSIDDVFNIVLFTIILGINMGTGVNTSLLITIPSSFILGVLLGLITGFLLSYLFKKIHMRDTNKVIILLGVAFLFITIENGLKDYVAISGLLATMVNGIVILKKRPVVAKRISTKFSKLWVGAEIILFVMVGATVNINFATNYLWQAIVLLIIILFIRAIGILICLINSSLNGKEKLFATLTGIPKATVQAAIGGIPLSMGLPSGEIILAISVIAILFTAPLGAFAIDQTYEILLKKEEITS